MKISINKEKTLRRGGLLLAELFVVFLGVYAAFLLNRHQDAARDDARRAQIHQTILTSVLQLERDIATTSTRFDSLYILGFVQPYWEDKTPQVKSIWVSGFWPQVTWQSILSGGGVDVLEPAFIQQLETHAGIVDFTTKQMERATHLSDIQITPNLGKGKSEFYEKNGNRLKEKYQWYAYTLQWLQYDLEKMKAQTRNLRRYLENKTALQKS